MERLFVALPLPPIIKDQLILLSGGVPGARWQSTEQMHLTLRFIGEVDGVASANIIAALSAVKAEPLTLKLKGCGVFGPRGRERILWVGVDQNHGLAGLRDRIEAVLVREGLAPDKRKFHPHVTIARLKGAPKRRLSDFVAANSLFRSPAFQIDEFDLYSSFRSHNGAIYRVEEAYPLSELEPKASKYALN